MTIFYADSAGAQGTGDGSSAANAATLKECLENDAGLHASLAAGDTIYCKGGTEISYDGSAGAFATTSNPGTEAASVRVVGYTTTVGDGGNVDLRDSDDGASNHCFIIGSNWMFQNFRVYDARVAWDGSNVNGCYFENCAVIGGANTDGWNLGSGTGAVNHFSNCYVSGKNDGFNVRSRGARFEGCIAIDCSGAGFEIGNSVDGCVIIDCIAHDCTGDGISVNGESLVIGCMANRNGGNGFYFSGNDGPNIIINSSATSNGAYGINGGAGIEVDANNCALNPTNETNTSGKSNNITLIERNEVTTDPQFTDSNPVTPTDVNLSLGASSAWKAGSRRSIGSTYFTNFDDFRDLAAFQHEDSGGGGGGDTIINGGFQPLEAGIL